MNKKSLHSLRRGKGEKGYSKREIMIVRYKKKKQNANNENLRFLVLYFMM